MMCLAVFASESVSIANTCHSPLLETGDTFLQSIAASEGI